MRLERRDRSKRGFHLSGLGDKPDLCCDDKPLNYPPTQVKIFDFKFFSVISVKNHFQPLVTETPPPPVTQTLVGRGRWKFFSLCKKSLLGTEQGWYGSSSVFRYTDCYYSLHFPNVAFHPQGHLTAHSNHWSTSHHVCIPERKLEERQKKTKKVCTKHLKISGHISLTTTLPNGHSKLKKIGWEM